MVALDDFKKILLLQDFTDPMLEKDLFQVVEGYHTGLLVRPDRIE